MTSYHGGIIQVPPSVNYPTKNIKRTNPDSYFVLSLGANVNNNNLTSDYTVLADIYRRLCELLTSDYTVLADIYRGLCELLTSDYTVLAEIYRGLCELLTSDYTVLADILQVISQPANQSLKQANLKPFMAFRSVVSRSYLVWINTYFKLFYLILNAVFGHFPTYILMTKMLTLK